MFVWRGAVLALQNVPHAFLMQLISDKFMALKSEYICGNIAQSNFKDMPYIIYGV